jgi:hypothetical protein
LGTGERIIPACERRGRYRRREVGEVSSVKRKWLDFETQLSLWLSEERLGGVF